MTRFLTPQELLQVAQTLPGDPACHDLGVLDGICARARARYMGRDVYGSDWLKAAAMLESTALHEPLEDKNLFFAWLVAEVFLNTNGIYMQYEPEDPSPWCCGRSTRAQASRRSPPSSGPGRPPDLLSPVCHASRRVRVFAL
ncbi:hypothetical protein [Actinacidiphila oryziradicis]|uniref:Fido domain-containing protein n=1 Tax=Actinacidiphila oryziradicis TaxID=2571141 RepID=A0A4U0S274_9ACTN|nr:hypothetical protein [Actinacidiphila oryziradicis]TKA02238.1 hypothetical protein FCI23_38520 [Actinacidiphila oryziradicis]